jgi:superfamily II helicase
VIAERARFRYARKIERAVGYRLPDQAFSGTMLDAIYSHLDFDRLDHTLKEQILSFFDSFLRCNCRDAPMCGCPERAFTRELVEIRENGLNHRQISDYLLDEYGIDIYPADVLSFLEETVHVLEAIRDIANLKEIPDLESSTREHIARIER